MVFKKGEIVFNSFYLKVINFYMNLICSRNETQQSDLKVYSFATFFFPRLSKDGFRGVQRWTKKVDLFAYNIILVPIHLGLHWTLSVSVEALRILPLNRLLLNLSHFTPGYRHNK